MKKAIVVLLALIVVPAWLFGTGADEQEASAGGLQVEAVSFPLAEPLELHFMLQTRLHDDLNDLEIFQRMQETTNVFVNWEIIQSGWNEKKSLMFASNDLPDAFFGAKALNIVDVLNNASFFTPLEDYVDAVAPNIQAMFENEAELLGYVTAADGHIYSIPQRMPNRPVTRFDMWINTDWLDAVGMDMPTTTDEYRDVLRAFKNEDPNGNGEADELPLVFNNMNNNSGVNNLFGAFGLSDNTNGDWINVENGRLSYSLADERVKDAISYLHELYAEDLFNSENFTRTWGQMVALNRNPDIAIVGSGFHWTIGAAMNSAERSAQYAPLPPLTGPNGDQLWRHAPTMTVNPVAFAMPVDNPAKAVTMAYVDQFYNPEVGVELYFGPVGTSLELDATGTYTVLESANPDLTQDAWLWSNGMNDLSPVYFSEEFEQRIQLAYPDEKADIDAVFAPYVPAETFPPFLQFTPEEISELSVLKAEINDFATETTSQWIMNGNIDEEWDAYQRQLEVMGLERMLEIYDDAYQRYLWN